MPATVKVWFTGGVRGKVRPLHSTTVSLSSTLAVNLKVDVRSAIPFTTVLVTVRLA